MHFSQRTAWNTEESDLARAHRLRLSSGLPIVDLTASNPTRCGFTYPDDLLYPLTDPAAFDYDPDPRGSHSARQAVCAYYHDHNANLDPNQLILTTSTSEAYAFLFKLLCDPGDEILVPQPSYPLFDFLADIETVQLAYTPLIYDHGWQLDLEILRRSITPHTRAIVLVHPNNPTGHYTTASEAQALAAFCGEHNLALIVDEVFLDYPFADPATAAETFAGRELACPVFVVSGLSKIVGLPQMKAAWLAASGPGTSEALARLEVIADTYLSMNAPIQGALPIWLNQRTQIQSQIRQRVQANLAELDRQLAFQSDRLVNRLSVQGGWYAILRIPALQPDEQTVRELLEVGIWIHPGHFFGMSATGWLVVSLLTPNPDFSTGIKVVLTHLGRNQEGNSTQLKT